MTVAFFNAGVHFEYDEDAIKTVVEFPESLFNRIESSAKKLGVSMPDLFNLVLREKFPGGSAPAVLVHQEGNVDLAFFGEKEETFLATVNLSDEEFAKLRRRTALENISLEQLLITGFEHMADTAPVNGGAL